ncbi:MAG TPA: hypothetical protein VFE79_06340 [Paraburkholderia sp.]|jgi:hypothetical protein|nr:hypothetical protein [Paraburkholderia sp.]
MATNTFATLVRRALEATLVPLIAIRYETILEHVAELRPQAPSRSVEVVTLVGIGVLAFLAAFVVELMLDGIADYINRKRRLKVQGVDLVDGEWIDVIREEGGKTITEMSVIRIETSRAEGFRISGATYDVRDLHEPIGEFYTVRSIATEKGVLFEYGGHERKKASDGKQAMHHGSCSYTFSSPPSNPPEKRFIGAFFAHEEAYVRTVQGRQIRKAEQKAFRTEAGRQAIMREFLARHDAAGAEPPRSSQD